MGVRTTTDPRTLFRAEQHWCAADTPIGRIALGFSERGIFRLVLPPASVRIIPDSPLPADLNRALQSFFAGQGPGPEIRLHLMGTPFRRSVWSVIRSINAGETWSYGEVAARLGSQGSARAVGGACGANPIPLFVPCHRVVAHSGLGGFTGGLDLKRQLLACDRGEVSKPQVCEVPPQKR